MILIFSSSYRNGILNFFVKNPSQSVVVSCKDLSKKVGRFSWVLSSFIQQSLERDPLMNFSRCTIWIDEKLMSIMIRILMKRYKDHDRIFESDCPHYSFLFTSSRNLEQVRTINSLKDFIKSSLWKFLRLIQNLVTIFNWTKNRGSCKLFLDLTQVFDRILNDILARHEEDYHHFWIKNNSKNFWFL